VDAVTLDGLLGELRPALVGRHLGRVRVSGPHAVCFEVGGERSRLWLEAGRGLAGPYWLERAETGRLAELDGGEQAAGGRMRQALLLFRKHAVGGRVTALRRVAGERVVVLEAGDAALVLRLSGPAPALTLAVSGEALATVGDGPPAWPVPEPDPARDWDRVDAALVARAVDHADGAPLRAVLAVAPALGPTLARLVLAGGGLDELRARLRAARPTLVAPAPAAEWTDAALASEKATQLLPLAPQDPQGVVISPATWTAAAALFLAARLRGQAFASRRRHALDEARRRLRRLVQLQAHLEGDLARMPAAPELRRKAEALLAAPGLELRAEQVRVEDPYAPGQRLEVAVDSRLSAPRNADRLFAKARRIERARGIVEARLAETRAQLEAARRVEDRLSAARNLDDLTPGPAPRPAAGPSPGAAGPRCYLTSGGLAVLVGRGARENHQVTFARARPEDLWLHARDVPGAHVVLRDDGGRAGPGDVREAAEIAAHFSARQAEARVDVLVTRRKHVRPARGGPGRVTLGHSETLRVEPRDPEGRLRRR
jgi:hypothetical protein